MHPGKGNRLAGRTRRGGTLIDVILGVLIVLLLCVIVFQGIIPGISTHDSRPRTQCAANLGGLGRCMLIYAESNRGHLPVAAHDPEQIDGPAWVRSAAFVGVRRDLPDRVTDADHPDENLQNNGSNTRSIVKLLRGGKNAYLKSRQLICPKAKHLGHDYGDASTREKNHEYERYYDFRGTRSTRAASEMSEFSYSFQVTLTTNVGTAEQPDIRGMGLTNTMDPGIAIAADRNPYSNEIQTVGGQQVYVWNPAAKGMTLPLSGANFTDKNLRSDTRANSRNHNGEGQNVAYLDGHAKWANNPMVGVDEDFLWGPVDPAKGFQPAEPGHGLNYGLTRPHTGFGPDGKTRWTTDSVLLP